MVAVSIPKPDDAPVTRTTLGSGIEARKRRKLIWFASDLSD